MVSRTQAEAITKALNDTGCKVRSISSGSRNHYSASFTDGEKGSPKILKWMEAN